MKQATMPLTDYQNACDAIREKTGTTDLIKSGEMAEKIMGISGGSEDGSYDEGFEDGKKAEYDAFWDNLQNYGDSNTDYRYKFYYWNDGCYNPKYPIYTTKANIGACFQNAQITNTLVDIDLTGTENAGSLFASCSLLITIPKLVFGENLTSINSMFNSCVNLENLNVEGIIALSGLNLQWSTKLTHDSLMSIIHALKDFSTLITFDEGATLTSATYSKISDNVLEEGKTYYLTFYSMEYNGNEQPLFIDNPRIAKKENVYGVGERVAIHYDVPYWVYPEKTYHFVIYQDGQELKELRYVEDETGEIWTDIGFDGDRIETIKTKQGEGTHTVTLGTTNLAKLTDAEKVQATEKGWTLL